MGVIAGATLFALVLVSFVGNAMTPFYQEPQNVDTSDWQTYKNDEFGFEFKYPKEAIIEGIPGENLNGDSETPELCISINQGNSYIYIGMPPYILCGGTTGLGIGDIKVTEKVYIGDTLHEAQGWRMDQFKEFLGVSGTGNVSIIYEVSNWQSLDEVEYEKAKDLNYAILSTFKFTR